jgi:hypothetical protein
MKYVVTEIDTDRVVGEYATCDDAISAGQSNGAFFAITLDSGQAVGVGSLIQYKQQNGRRGLMWNIILL